MGLLACSRSLVGLQLEHIDAIERRSREYVLDYRGSTRDKLSVIKSFCISDSTLVERRSMTYGDSFAIENSKINARLCYNYFSVFLFTD